MYFNARYYDSSLGQFLSPDTLVPDAGQVLESVHLTRLCLRRTRCRLTMIGE
jgi:hypothetical protein